MGALANSTLTGMRALLLHIIDYQMKNCLGGPDSRFCPANTKNDIELFFGITKKITFY